VSIFGRLCFAPRHELFTTPLRVVFRWMDHRTRTWVDGDASQTWVWAKPNSTWARLSKQITGEGH